MDEIIVKQEYKSACRLCLSSDRALVKIGDEYMILYQLLTSNFQRDTCDMKWLICWECRAKLRNIKEFQHQVYRVNQILMTGIPPILESLSTLSVSLAYQFTLDPTIDLNDIDVLDSPVFIAEHNVPVTFKATESDYQVVSKVSNITHIEIANTLLQEDVSLKIEDDENMSEVENTVCAFDTEINLDEQDDEDDYLEVRKESVSKKKNKNKDIVRRPHRKKNAKCNQPKFKVLSMEKFKVSDYFTKIYRDTCHSPTNKDKGFKFRCDACDLYFENGMALSIHERYHRERKHLFVCDICSRTQRTRKDIREHVNFRHLYYYKCRFCEDDFFHTAHHCIIHYQKVHVKKYECTLCQVKFRGRTDFYNHWENLHSRFVCDDCGLVRSTKENLITHIRFKHLNIKSKQPFLYRCERCCRRFKTLKNFQLHMETLHGPDASPSYCVECDMHFLSAFKYKRHLTTTRRHGGGKPKRIVECPACKKFFKGNAYMQDHYDFVHLKNYKYRCEECNQNFARKYKLDDHNKRHHLGIMPPKNKICKVCDRGFTSNKILENHMRTHTGERPYMCSCGAAFAQSYALTTHARKQGHTALPFIKKQPPPQ